MRIELGALLNSLRSHELAKKNEARWKTRCDAAITSVRERLRFERKATLRERQTLEGAQSPAGRRRWQDAAGRALAAMREETLTVPEGDEQSSNPRRTASKV